MNKRNKTTETARPAPTARDVAKLRAENDRLKRALDKARTELHVRTDSLGTEELQALFYRLAESFTRMLRHPEYPREVNGEAMWLWYYYLCGLARVDCGDFRDDALRAAEPAAFGAVAQQFGEALASVLECDDITITVFNSLSSFFCDTQDMLLCRQHVPRRTATKVRLAFSPAAQAAFTDAP